MALGAKQDWMETQSATRQVIGGVRRLSRTSLRNQQGSFQGISRLRTIVPMACMRREPSRAPNLATTDANLAASEQGT